MGVTILNLHIFLVDLPIMTFLSPQTRELWEIMIYKFYKKHA